jgi:hypothetical protein
VGATARATAPSKRELKAAAKRAKKLEQAARKAARGRAATAAGGGRAASQSTTSDMGLVHEAKVARPSTPKLPFELRLVAWSVDFAFVVACVGLAMALAAILAAARSGDGAGLLARDWLALAPVQWLAAFPPHYILGGVYAVYLLYHLVFKLLAGTTMGETLLVGWRQRRATPRAR